MGVLQRRATYLLEGLRYTSATEPAPAVSIKKVEHDVDVSRRLCNIVGSGILGDRVEDAIGVPVGEDVVKVTHRVQVALMAVVIAEGADILRLATSEVFILFIYLF